LFPVLAVASLSKMIPLGGDIQATFSADAQGFALLLSILALPPALFAALGGAVVDRIGQRRSLMVSAGIGVVADIAYLVAPSLGVFQIVRLLEGLVMMGVFTAGPALLMATTSGQRRVSAMTLWATYSPTGFSLGLVLGAAFAGTPWWRWTFLAHAALFAAVGLMALGLPRAEAESGPVRRWTESIAQLFAAYRRPQLLRLALAFGLIVCIGLGVSVVTPARLAAAKGVSLGAASTLLAVANFSMLLGALLTAVWLRRGGRAGLLFAALALSGSLAAGVLFAPFAGFPAMMTALCLWLLVNGAASAFVLAVLPAVLASPAEGAAAAGLFSQVSSVVTLVTPPLWLGLNAGGWPAFVGGICAAWGLSFLLLPSSAIRFAAIRSATAR
jgi:predicted MFS family arabinose efflux permease